MSLLIDHDHPISPFTNLTGNHIAVRFEYEWHDNAGQW
jgi:nuclear transport factor 2 (NTF2) superfamily protein